MHPHQGTPGPLAYVGGPWLRRRRSDRAAARRSTRGPRASANRSGDGRWSRSSLGPSGGGRAASRPSSTTRRTPRVPCSRGSRCPPSVAIVGGDGTVRHAAGILAGRPTPDGDLPGRDRRRPCGEPGDSGARPIRGRRCRRPACHGRSTGCRGVGGGRVRRAPMVKACSSLPPATGLDPRIMAAAHEDWKQRLRFGAYVGGRYARSSVWPRPIVITADGETIERRGHRRRSPTTGEIDPGGRSPICCHGPGRWQRLDLLVAGGRGIPGGLRQRRRPLLRSGELDGATIRRRTHEVRIEVTRRSRSKPTATRIPRVGSPLG